MKEILDCLSVNIANVYLRRINALEGTALTIIELDENVSDEVIRCLKSLKNVTEVYFVKLEEVEAF